MRRKCGMEVSPCSVKEASEGNGVALAADDTCSNSGKALVKIAFFSMSDEEVVHSFRLWVERKMDKPFP